MATFRVHKESGNFVTVHKDFIYDNKLSARSKGILLYLLSRPNDWQIYTSEVQKHMKDGVKSVNSAVNELISIGYIKRTLKRSENGTFKGYEYQVYEIPTEMPLAENGSTENGLSVNGETENRKGHTTNNNRTNNDLTYNDNTKNDSSNQPQQSNVYDFYQKNGFGIMRPIIIDQIKDWINDFGENGEEIVIEALKEAVNQNVTNWSYTNAILKSWYNDNIKSIEDVQARKNKREKTNSSNENDDWLNSPERQQYLNAFDNGGLL
ncbi:DnaD domain protein [Staphylococcus ureilyticus]|uniref:DnaD domain protein n=1 Tax=Staphylococcus ureilyticus TaxID=94138 RepID=UPI0021D20918|nr:DnaD domain protein [Staphylococcus ureilyticus]UXS59864.1 DnaD domain protein [Staphylococcus ureilyticus]